MGDPAFQDRLERAFRNAKAPGSLATSLTASPELAAELTAAVTAAYLRDRAASMRREGRALGAAILGRLAGEVDTRDPVMGAPAAGGTR